MLTTLVVLPVAVAALVMVAPRRLVSAGWYAATAAEIGLTAAVWAGYHSGGGFGYQVRTDWIPGAGVDYHVGVDGLSLPLVAVTCVLFGAVAVFAPPERRTDRRFVALFLFLQATCVGLFVALDLILFFVFFDLSIVAMYFVIAGWGHPGSGRAALKFFLYTFTGSLALLLGFIGLYLAVDPHTFDLVDLIAANPLAGRATYGGVVLLAIAVGFAIKTPTVPFHTWLPPAHTEAPAEGSAILAGVLLKMGTYGFLRIAMPVLPEAWRRYALVVVIVGVVSVLYGALVALAQTSFKRMVAYTSVNHMGYIVLAIGAAASGGRAGADHLAVTGAVVQMVSHGLLTGALFLLSGVLYQRGGTYEMPEYSGIAARAPVLAGLTGVAAFASLGIPGFAGFIAEFQIFAGSLGPRPIATGLALLGIATTAGLFLRAIRSVFLGPLRTPGNRPFADIPAREAAAVTALLVLAAVIGIAPRFLLDVIEPASRAVLGLLGR